MKPSMATVATVVLFLTTLRSPAQRIIYTADSSVFLAPGNLIANGDFENGFTGWVGTYGLLSLNNYPINPGPLSGTTVGVVDDSEPAMRQSISTVVGTTYAISFGIRLPDLGPNGVPIEGDSDVDPALLNLMCNDQSVVQLLVLNRTIWANYTFDFTAQSTSSELEFSIPEYLSFPGQLERSD